MVLKKKIEEINPFIKIYTQNIKIAEENVKNLFSDYDIISAIIGRTRRYIREDFKNE
jgi:molybdopterin/thiamine biosynthesis adenylyltransferase